MKPLRIGIVGVGKIAREQHIPAIQKNIAFDLVACADNSESSETSADYSSLQEMLDGHLDLDAVAICTPPQTHYEAAHLALANGKHVILEKPPCETTAQLDELVQLARQADRTLFQTWHACHAAAVDTAQHLLAKRTIRGVRIVWKEDVRQCHPGQRWLWETGGFGVFDAGINALSILTKIILEPISVNSATLSFPANCETPIAADVLFVTESGRRIDAGFDFRSRTDAVWDILFETDEGTVCLGAYGNTLFVDGKQIVVEAADDEYSLLYHRFAELIREHQSEVDKRPLQLVIDILRTGKRITVELFDALGEY